MGIRFACPNGHRLNVKAYLAGQRGICPDCGARMKIPHESQLPPRRQAASQPAVEVVRNVATSRVPRQLPPRRQSAKSDPAPGAPRADESMIIKTERVAETPVGDPQAPLHDNGAPPVTTGPVWYVRPPAGGQFGPAGEETVKRWISERRIVADTYVWREGWPDWRRAGDPETQLPAPLTAQSRVAAPPTDEAGVARALADAFTPTAQIQSPNSRRRGERTQWALVLVLALLVVVLSCVLAWVLVRPQPAPDVNDLVQRNTTLATLV